MNSVTLDWMDLAVILSTFVSCAVVGLLAAFLMSRFEAVNPMEPVAPVVDVQHIEVTVVDRGWKRWRMKAAPGAMRPIAAARVRQINDAIEAKADKHKRCAIFLVRKCILARRLPDR